MRIFTQEEKNLVYNIYSNGGTTKDCLSAVHCSQDSLRKLLKELGIYRTHKQAVQLCPQNLPFYPVKEDFFFNMNDKLAYVLGFLAADGSVSSSDHTIEIKLSAVDKTFLELLKEYIGGRPISYYQTIDGFQVACLSFASKRVKEELSKYNIVPQKTFTFSFPTNIPEQYQIDFIRGYFDGDGSISTAGKSAIRWQLCGARKEVLEYIINFLYEKYSIPKVSIQVQQKQSPLYFFQYSTTATIKLYDILYYSQDILFLPRKKEKYEMLLNK